MEYYNNMGITHTMKSSQHKVVKFYINFDMSKIPIIEKYTDSNGSPLSIPVVKVFETFSYDHKKFIKQLRTDSKTNPQKYENIKEIFKKDDKEQFIKKYIFVTEFDENITALIYYSDLNQFEWEVDVPSEKFFKKFNIDKLAELNSYESTKFAIMRTELPFTPFS